MHFYGYCVENTPETKDEIRKVLIREGIHGAGSTSLNSLLSTCRYICVYKNLKKIAANDRERDVWKTVTLEELRLMFEDKNSTEPQAAKAGTY